VPDPIRIIRPDQLVEADPTYGMFRQRAFAASGLWAGQVTTAADPGDVAVDGVEAAQLLVGVDVRRPPGRVAVHRTRDARCGGAEEQGRGQGGDPEKYAHGAHPDLSVTRSARPRRGRASGRSGQRQQPAVLTGSADLSRGAGVPDRR